MGPSIWSQTVDCELEAPLQYLPFGHKSVREELHALGQTVSSADACVTFIHEFLAIWPSLQISWRVIQINILSDSLLQLLLKCILFIWIINNQFMGVDKLKKNPAVVFWALSHINKRPQTFNQSHNTGHICLWEKVGPCVKKGQANDNVYHFQWFSLFCNNENRFLSFRWSMFILVTLFHPGWFDCNWIALIESVPMWLLDVQLEMILQC